MKKSLLLLLGLTMLSGAAYAQLQKGSRYWGATASFQGDNTRDVYATNLNYTSDYFSITPSVQTGWFFADNKMFGLRLNSSLRWSKNHNEGPGYDNKSQNKYLSFNLSPFIRHYKSLSPKWALFLHSGADLWYSRNVTKTIETDNSNGYGGGLYVNPGLTFWLTPRFALESDIYLLSLSAGYSRANDNNTVNFNAGVTSSINNYFGLRASWYLQSK